MSRLTLFFLKPPAIKRDAKPIKIKIRKGLALLAYLAVTGGVHSREALATLFWPQSNQKRAFQSLRTALMTLKKQLGSDYFVIDRQNIGLNWQADIWLDVAEFRQRLNFSTTAPLSLTSVEKRNHLEAIELYQANFLSGFTLTDSPAFDEWQFFEREELRQAFINLLEITIIVCKAKQAYEDALPHARRWVEVDTLHEPAHFELIQLYAECGQRAAALRQYEECKRILDEELGVPPTIETTALYESIRTSAFSPTANQAIPADDFTLIEETFVQPIAPTNQGPRVKKKVNTSPSQTPLPVPSTSFVGRKDELNDLASYLANPNCRLITLVGLGGIGKTRLAIEAATRQRTQFKDGVCYIDLTPLRSDQSIIMTTRQALGLLFQDQANPQQQLFSYLHDKEMLLLFDNFEEFVDEALLMKNILSQAPYLKIMVTSREGLNLEEEWSYYVSGLPVPNNIGNDDSSDHNAEHTYNDEYTPNKVRFDDETVFYGNVNFHYGGYSPTNKPSNDGKHFYDSIGSYSSVRLFTQRAHQVKSDFSLTTEAVGVARICQLLEGAPLGLELAAPWVKVLSCAEIVQEISKNLDFLNNPKRNIPDRHRSLRAVFEHSWKLLSSPEQKTLAQLSIFRGGFSREALLEVCQTSLFSMYSLVNKSLLKRAENERYTLHELLRQFAAEKLEADPLLKRECQNRLALYYGCFLRQREALWDSKHEQDVVAAVEIEFQNIQTGWRWAASQQNVAVLEHYLEGLLIFYETKSWYQQGLETFALVSTHLSHTALLENEADDVQAKNRFFLAKALTRQAIFQQEVGQPDVAYQLIVYSLALLNEHQDLAELALAYKVWGGINYFQGNYVEARQRLTYSLEIAPKTVSLGQTANTYLFLGAVAFATGDYLKAQDYHQTSLTLYQKAQKWVGVGHATRWLGAVAQARGEYEQAEYLFKQSLSLFEEVNQLTGLAFCYSNLGILSQYLKEYNQAKDWFQKCYLLHKKTGEYFGQIRTLNHLGDVCHLCQEYDEAKAYLQKALRLAIMIKSAPLTLQAIANVASLTLKTEALLETIEQLAGDTELTLTELANNQVVKSLALFNLVIEHPATHQTVRHQAEERLEAHLSELRFSLSPAVVAKLQAVGKNKKLDETITQMLATGKRELAFLEEG